MDKKVFHSVVRSCKLIGPNDPKLSDGGAWRGSCEGGAKKEATGVGQRWLGVKTPKLEIAATVTRGAVRCSAWLGAFGFGMAKLIDVADEITKLVNRANNHLASIARRECDGCNTAATVEEILMNCK